MVRKYVHYTAVQTAIDTLIEHSFTKMMNDICDKLSDLDPSDPNTLKVAVTALLNSNIEQKTIAELLSTSRTQIARWSQGANIPKQPGFRAWVVGELLKFMKEQASNPTRPNHTAKETPEELPEGPA